VNHFFRGRLALLGSVLKENYSDIDYFTYTIKNVSQQDMNFSLGKFEVFYDRLVDDGVTSVVKTVKAQSVDISSWEHGSSNDITFSLPKKSMRDGGKLRFVYSGDIGDDFGIAALVVDQPIKGFIIKPTQTPSDGIPGKRLLYKDGAFWRLAQNQKSLNGGNIDWKGWYLNGKPTRSLSWKGPISRYFSQAERNQYTGIQIPFSNTIYEDGKALAKTPWPYLVFGAALTKDSAGNHWIVVICNNKTEDAVLIKPYNRDTSTRWYDENTAPTGWRLIKQFPMDPGRRYPAATPWFFNGDGNEARTMRDDGSVLAGGVIYDQLKINVSVDSKIANIQNLGNGSVTSNGSFIRDVYLNSANRYIGTETQTSSSNGTYTIAVDYGGVSGNDLLVASVGLNYASSSESIHGEAINDLSVSSSRSYYTVLNWTGDSVRLLDSSSSYEAYFTQIEESPVAFTSDTPKAYSEKIVFMDLRSGILSTEVTSRSSHSNESGGSSHTRITNLIRTSSGIYREELISDETRPIGPSSPSLHWDSTSGSSSYSTSGSTGYSVPKVNSSIYTPYQDRDLFWEGSWVTDMDGNVMISQELTNYGSINGYLTIFSGGNMNDITGVGEENARYYPIYIK
jgi:hypothetical protein